MVSTSLKANTVSFDCSFPVYGPVIPGGGWLGSGAAAGGSGGAEGGVSDFEGSRTGVGWKHRLFDISGDT